MKSMPRRRFLFVAVACCFVAGNGLAQDKPKGVHNDLIYPPSAGAKPFVDFDGKGFIIGGKRTFLSSGSIHYPRVPRKLWDDRMLRMQQANFNCIETYAFWNLNEPRENAFDFAGDKDIGAFFEAAQRHGLYGIARVGPYVCAEWDLGGFPIWLKFKPEMNVRTDDPAYLALSDHWYDKIFPVLDSHQINRGGNIVLVQLENEHPLGWGVVDDRPYFVHVKETALKDGLAVPFFMSGLHHGGPPRAPSTDAMPRANPWFTTEFWAGWFDAYRTLSEKRARGIDMMQWNIVARGGGGYNFYMVHGGTDFASYNDDSVAASYDYGTAIGQAGDLRPMYYRMKRVNQLVQSFPAIFADGTDALPAQADAATGPGVKVIGARQSAAGTFVFLQNDQPDPAAATLKSGEKLTLSRYGTYPLPRDVTIARDVKITDSTLPVLALARHGDTATLAVYGEPGEKGRLTLASAAPVKPGATSNGIAASLTRPGFIDLAITIPAEGMEACQLDFGAQTLRVLAINRDLSLYTWVIGTAGKQEMVVGPAFVRDFQETDGKPSLVIERPYGQPAPGQVAVFGGRGQEWHLGAKSDPGLDDRTAPALGAWEQSVCPEGDASFDDSKWPVNEQPEEMGAHGNIGAFAWYRTTVDVPTAGSGKLSFKSGDNAQVIVNGRPVPSTKTTAAVELAAGKNTIAFLVSHHGRNKAFNYTRSLVHRDDKGLIGAPTLELGGTRRELTGWRMAAGPSENAPKIENWTPVSNPAPPETGRPAFYQARFTARPPADLGAYPILRATFAGLTRGTMWINGHSLGQYPERIRIDSLYIPECWLNASDDNVLTVFDGKGARPEQVRVVVEKPASRELIQVSVPVPPATPLRVAQENPPRDLAAANTGNLAFRRPATASASRADSPPDAATDGDAETHWTAPEKTDDVSLMVDLGKSFDVAVCEIMWNGPAKNFHYTLEGSPDAARWSKLGDHTTAVPTSPDSPSELSRLNLSGAGFRYLRVTIPSITAGAGIAELRAFEPAK